MSGSQIAQLVEHSHCKRGVPGLSPGLTVHFSPPFTFGGQRGTKHACLVSLILKPCNENLPSKFEDEFQSCGGVCHCTDLVTTGEIMSGCWIAQSVEHSSCKREVPDSIPGLTAHFSHPVTCLMIERLASLVQNLI